MSSTCLPDVFHKNTCIFQRLPQTIPRCPRRYANARIFLQDVWRTPRTRGHLPSDFLEDTNGEQKLELLCLKTSLQQSTSWLNPGYTLVTPWLHQVTPWLHPGYTLVTPWLHLATPWLRLPTQHVPKTTFSMCLPDVFHNTHQDFLSSTRDYSTQEACTSPTCLADVVCNNAGRSHLRSCLAACALSLIQHKDFGRQTAPGTLSNWTVL